MGTWSAAAVKAFNRGSQARINGEPLSANPYTGNARQNERAAWVDGWWDCEWFWSAEVCGRWEFTPLPALREGAFCG